MKSNLTALRRRRASVFVEARVTDLWAAFCVRRSLGSAVPIETSLTRLSQELALPLVFGRPKYPNPEHTGNSKGSTRQMALLGYARVSTDEQSLDIQRESLRAAGCEVIREEKASGSSRAGRSELQTLLDFIRKGDVLVVTRIDRLARSMRDLQNIVFEIRAKGADLRATEQPIDTGTAAGKAFLDMLGVFAEFELNLRVERQREGIAKAKAAGRYKGRKRRTTADEVRSLKAAGLGPSAIAKELGCGRASVYRALARDEQSIESVARATSA